MVLIVNFLNFEKRHHGWFVSRVISVFINKTWLISFFSFPLLLFGQTVQVNGSVKDIDGKSLPYADVFILPDSTIVASNLEGDFSFKIHSGSKSIKISYMGFESFQSTLLLESDTSITIFLNSAIGQLEEVSVTAKRYSQKELVTSERTGTTTLSRTDITSIPALGGEADVIKTLQLLPGVTRGIEGSSDLFVRGGAADQNLVLLDGAPIYNTSHLFGFISVFNPDMLEKVEAITGGFPAEYGGRLSSIIDITSLDRIADQTHVSGNVGLIASRLFVEQPLLKDKLSLWVSGRRTYIDQIIKVTGETLPYHFYDLNGKIIFEPTKHDQFSFSYYGGEDKLNLSQGEDEENFGFTSTYVSGNSSQSFQWRHRNPGSWNIDLSLFHTAFNYDIVNIFDEDTLTAFSFIEDYGGRFSFQKASEGNGEGLKTGIEWTRHAVSPNLVNSTGIFSEFLENSLIKGIVAHEIAAFLQKNWQIGENFLINAGLRGSLGLVENKKYFNPEPRISIKYAVGENQSIKVSYSRMTQYMHRISNSAVSMPTDIWYTVTDSIKPQRSNQVALAWQKFLPKQDFFFSAEAYYKAMDHLIGYEEGTNLFFNKDFESSLIQGKGSSYGLEFLLRKEAGKLTGWLGYTLSWSLRNFDGINGGSWFPARYDRRHNGALVMQYKFHNRWAASMVWEYISGSRFTPVIGQYAVLKPGFSGVDLIPEYSGINEVKLSDTHRLDLGIKFMSKPNKRFGWHLSVGVNNVYNRASPIGIFIEQDETDGSLQYSQPGLFGLLPFISFGFNFY